MDCHRINRNIIGIWCRIWCKCMERLYWRKALLINLSLTFRDQVHWLCSVLGLYPGTMGFFEPNNAVKQTGNHRDLYRRQEHICRGERYGTNREKPIKLRLSIDFSGRVKEKLPVTKLQSQWLRCIIGQLIVKEKDATILRQILTSHEHLGLGTACCYTTHGLQSWLARRWRHLQFIGCLFIKEVNYNLVLKRLGHIPNNIPNKALLDMPTALKPLMN